MKRKSTEQLIFPILVGTLSLVSLFLNFNEFHVSLLLVSLLGITATSLFFLNKKQSTLLFYVWIIAQLVTYTSESFSYITNQFPYLHIRYTFHMKDSVLVINLLPLFFFIGYRLTQLYDFIGRQVIIKPIKTDAALLTIEGEITEIINRHKDGKWLKVEYTNNETAEIQSVIIKPKGEERFGRKKYIIGFVKESSGNFNFIDWGKIKLK